MSVNKKKGVIFFVIMKAWCFSYFTDCDYGWVQLILFLQLVKSSVIYIDPVFSQHYKYYNFVSYVVGVTYSYT